MEKKSPLVSIITVCYNAEQTIEKTIKSVIAQTYSNIEYIIIDGNSTDNTLKVVEKYNDKISKVVCEKDNGIFDAMNKGIKHASGEYLWFVHADDQIYSDNALEIAMKVQADFIYGKAILVDENGVERGLEERKPHPSDSTLTWKSFLNGMIICHQAMIVKKDFCPQYVLEYNLVGDLDWAIKILKQVNSIVDCGTYLCKFVEGGTSTQHRKASLKQRFNILKSHYGIMQTLIQHIKITFNAIKRRSIK